MKLTVKYLKTFDLELPDDCSVEDLQKVIASHEQAIPSQVCMVFQGKIVKAKGKVKDTGIKDEDILSVLIKKAKKVPEEEEEKKPFIDPCSELTTEIMNSKPIDPKVTEDILLKEEVNTLPIKEPSIEESKLPPTKASIKEPSIPPTKEPEQQMKQESKDLQQLLDMGFPESESKLALQLAQGNIQIAVSYLTLGESELQKLKAEMQGAIPESEVGSDYSTEIHPALPQEASNLGEIEMAKKIINNLSDPAERQNMVDLMEVSNPNLGALAETNPELVIEKFRKVLNKKQTPSSLTPSKETMIKELKEKGYEEDMVMEALWVCEWDSKLAEEYLVKEYESQREELMWKHTNLPSNKFVERVQNPNTGTFAQSTLDSKFTEPPVTGPKIAPELSPSFPRGIPGHSLPSAIGMQKPAESFVKATPLPGENRNVSAKPAHKSTVLLVPRGGFGGFTRGAPKFGLNAGQLAIRPKDNDEEGNKVGSSLKMDAPSSIDKNNK